MTHRSFIEALGNGTAVAAEVSRRAGKKVDREAVYKWSSNGIPYRWRPYVVAIARERGIKVPKDLLPQ